MQKRRRTLVSGALAMAVAVTLAGAARAQETCTGALSAAGRAANPQNYDPPKHYNPDRLARDRAIGKWRELAASRCPKASTMWWRARDRRIECEGYAGGIECRATGTPAMRSGK